MSIRFRCPTCKKSLKADDDKAGTKTNCPDCGQRIRVPKPPMQKTVLGELETGMTHAASDVGQPASGITSAIPPSGAPFANGFYDFDTPGSFAGSQPLIPRSIEPHRGTAILIMGILGLFTLPFIFGPIAWMWANEDLRKMRRGLMDPEGKGSTEAGKIMGIIATVISLTALGLVISWLFCCLSLPALFYSAGGAGTFPR